MSQLSALQCSDNMIQGELFGPPMVGLSRMSKLSSLDVSRNQISRISKQVTDLPALTALDLSSNLITELPEALSTLQLKLLDVSKNPIASVPSSLRIDRLEVSIPTLIRPVSNLLSGKLFISGEEAAVNYAALSQLGISRVLVCTQRRSAASLSLDEICNVEHCLVKLDDSEYEHLTPKLPRCLEFIFSGLSAGHGVLVHCHAGKSRSAAVVVAWLMLICGMKYDEALAHVRQTHPVACPNKGFEMELKEMEASIPNEVCEEVEVIQQAIYHATSTSSAADNDQPQPDPELSLVACDEVEHVPRRIEVTAQQAYERVQSHYESVVQRVSTRLEASTLLEFHWQPGNERLSTPAASNRPTSILGLPPVLTELIIHHVGEVKTLCMIAECCKGGEQPSEVVARTKAKQIKSDATRPPYWSWKKVFSALMEDEDTDQNHLPERSPRMPATRPISALTTSSMGASSAAENDILDERVQVSWQFTVDDVIEQYEQEMDFGAEELSELIERANLNQNACSDVQAEIQVSGI